MYGIIVKNENGSRIEFQAERRGLAFVQPNFESSPGRETGCKLVRFEGLGETKAKHQLKSTYHQDGATHIETTLESAHPFLHFVLVARDYDHLADMRRNVNRVFNPKSQAFIEFRHGSKAYQLAVLAESVPTYGDEDQSGTVQQVQVGMVAPDPYWYEINESITNIVTWIGGMRFPWRLPAAFAKAGEKRLNVYNGGDVDTPVRVEFVAPATNPRITNERTGEYIQVNRELMQGEVLVVTTGYGDKRVEIDGVNRFNDLDQGSVFFSLLPGDNVINYTSQDLTESARVKITHTNRFLGV